MPKKVLLLGGTGGCGKHALLSLLSSGASVTALVRSSEKLTACLDDIEASRQSPSKTSRELLTIVEFTEGHLSMYIKSHVASCDAVVSCLGHNLSFKGLFRPPKRLCLDTSKIVFQSATKPIKLIVISTEGVDDPTGGDPPRAGLTERFVLWLLSYLLPPHADNMENISFLHSEASVNPLVEICAVRPCDLLDAASPSEYGLAAALQSGIFGGRTTVRANVGDFMARLVTDGDVWEQWKGKFPHIWDVKKE